MQHENERHQLRHLSTKLKQTRHTLHHDFNRLLRFRDTSWLLFSSTFSSPTLLTFFAAYGYGRKHSKILNPKSLSSDGHNSYHNNSNNRVTFYQEAVCTTYLEVCTMAGNALITIEGASGNFSAASAACRPVNLSKLLFIKCSFFIKQHKT